MSRDLALLDEGQPTCRLYEWSGFWVTLGRFQQASRDLLDPSGHPWVGRPTGGKAVLHGNDWTVALAVPLNHLATPEWPMEKLGRSVRQVYRRLVAPLIAALRDCGLPAVLAEDSAFVGGPRVADCFAHVSANDIVDSRTGAKLCGCALKLSPDNVLLQASIPKGPPLVPAREVLQGGEDLETLAWDFEKFPVSLAKTMRINPFSS